MRNPPIALKAFADNNTNETKIPMPTYIGSNTQYLSIPFLQFNLKGQGKYREMFMDPPILEFKEDLYIFKTYTRTITMKKKLNTEAKSLSADSNGDGCKKSIRVEGKSDESFIVDIDAKSFNESNLSSSIDIAVSIQSKTWGIKTAYLMIDIEDGVPLSYFIQANFIGPLVTIVEPNVEFGLQKIRTHTSFTMNITNHSPIEAPVIIK